MNHEGQQRYLEYLEEMTKLVQNLVEHTRPITTGAENLHGVWPIKDQYKHVSEEIMEAFAEYQYGTRPDNECEEDLDILFSALTILHKKGYTFMDIKFAVGRLQKKYTERGFLNFG